MYKWFIDYQKLDEEIAYLSLQIDLSIAELKRWSEGDLSRQSTFVTSLEKSIFLQKRIEELKIELEHKQKEKEEIMKLIDRFKGVEHQILRLKHIDGKTLEEVADELNYSYSYIKHKHAEVMRRIDFHLKSTTLK